MADLATLRLTWEPRMLSILRIIAGLLFMEHGLAKVLGFPLQPNHMPYALSTLNPGLQGLLELVGGLLLALGLFTRPGALRLGQLPAGVVRRSRPAARRRRAGRSAGRRPRSLEAGALPGSSHRRWCRPPGSCRGGLIGFVGCEQGRRLEGRRRSGFGRR